MVSEQSCNDFNSHVGSICVCGGHQIAGTQRVFARFNAKKLARVLCENQANGSEVHEVVRGATPAGAVFMAEIRERKPP